MMRIAASLALLVMGCTSPVPPGNDDGSVSIDASGTPDLSAGGCSPKCSGLSPFCNASKHCVACLADTDCAMGSFCKIISDAIATCTPGCMMDDRCPNGQKCCDSRCVDPNTDVKNCGGCAMACMAVHASATCVAGMCSAGKCDSGWGDCNKDGLDGCETNLHTDIDNCTGCGMKCSVPNAVAGCADGCYTKACNFGFDDCNLNGNDGCETSVLSDKNNCGACGKPCLNLPNATASCVNGTCLLGKCNIGFANCDGMNANGCEINTNTNVSHCGACGNVCPMGNICVGGGCTCPMCNIPNASAKCINNMCVFDKCNPGFGDCDNNQVNGCEVNLNFDKTNCGMCKNVCPMNNPSCAMGVCGQVAIYGPNHTFAGMTTDFYCSTGQGSCSLGNAAMDADYFCKRFYNNMNCMVMQGYMQVNVPGPNIAMHKNGGCTAMGSDIQGTMCDGGPCKIMMYPGGLSGLKNLVCACP